MSEPTHHESNRAFYDRIAGVYDWLADSNEKAARLAGVQALDLKAGERALELGFGTGNEVIEMAERVGAKGLVAGIDVSTGMLAVAQEKLGKATLAAKIDLRAGDARQLPWPDNSFDAVYCSFTLELFPDDDMRTVLVEVRRVLRMGGRFGVVSMASVKPGERASLLEHTYIWMHRHFPHIVDCRPIDVAGVVSGAGFRVVKANEVKIWTMPVGIVVANKE